ncbi:MAG: hypothetical protein IH586_06515, partial [Anaerolineaceae bacterium]|nr:hypothetical protein [Anaerolineaceae bacterium]
LENDQPVVPIYTLTYAYPAGISIQNVSLGVRSNRSEFNNLLLPLASMEPTASPRAALHAAAADPVPAWTPAVEQSFTWTVNNETDGTSTLVLTIYPFHYNAAARYADYYRHFEFQVRTIPTGTRIQAASTSADQYGLGETLTLDVDVENTGEPADRIISAAIFESGSGALAGGFPLTFLPALTGEGSSRLALSSPGLAAGGYTVRVELLDADGQIYDWREVPFKLGIHSGEISGLTPSKITFTPGDQVSFSGQVHNPGELLLDAQLVLEVSSVGGVSLVTQTQDLASILSGASEPFSFTWDSTGVDKGDYRLTAYLMYDSQTSPLAQAEMNTGSKIYIPIIMRK